MAILLNHVKSGLVRILERSPTSKRKIIQTWCRRKVVGCYFGAPKILTSTCYQGWTHEWTNRLLRNRDSTFQSAIISH